MKIKKYINAKIFHEKKYEIPNQKNLEKKLFLLNDNSGEFFTKAAFLNIYVFL